MVRMGKKAVISNRVISYKIEKIQNRPPDTVQCNLFGVVPPDTAGPVTAAGAYTASVPHHPFVAPGGNDGEFTSSCGLVFCAVNGPCLTVLLLECQQFVVDVVKLKCNRCQAYSILSYWCIVLPYEGYQYPRPHNCVVLVECHRHCASLGLD
jgi:hypothetical protein